MDGSKLALGAVAALGVASVVASKRGSRSSARPLVFLDMDDMLLKAKRIGEDGIEGMIESARRSAVRARSRLDGGKLNARMRSVLEKRIERSEREIRWLESAQILSFDGGQDEYAMVVRPGVVEALRELAERADLYVFSAGSEDYIDACMKATPIGGMVQGWFSSRLWNHDLPEIEGRPWVLVDDLEFSTAGTADKLRQILGIGEEEWREYGYTTERVPERYRRNHVHAPPFRMELPEPTPFDGGMAAVVKERLRELGWRQGSQAKAVTQDEHPWLPLALVEAAVPAMQAQGVSQVARGSQGFIEAYRSADGKPAALGDNQWKGRPWRKVRNEFVARHMGQVQKRGEPLWTEDGEPTRRHLALIAWAYSPDQARVKRWLGL